MDRDNGKDQSPVDTGQLQTWDKAYVWHPFTQHALWNEADPIVIVAGEREFVVDSQGRRYLDGHSSLWCNVHGHRHPTIDAAIRRQLAKISHSTLLGLASPGSILLAKRLVEITPPGLTKVFYSDDGSTAVEVACKTAAAYWHHRGQPDRTEFVALRNAYHGDTIGAVSLGGIDLFHHVYKPLLFKTHFAPSPYCYRCALGKEVSTCGLACADEIERILAERPGKIAAVAVEPLMQCAAGMIAAPPGHLKRIRKICDRHDVLLIADEVATGFGRTGKMFACEHEGVTPDVMCLSKGLTAGYMPLAATMTTQAIYEAFLGPINAGRTLYHGHTFTGNALGCAAALASLDVFEQEQTIAGLSERIACITGHLREMAALEHVGDTRQCGMMVGIEIVKDKATREAYPYGLQVGAKICRHAIRHGVIIRPLADTLVIFPPLCIAIENLEKLMTVVRQCIDEVMPRIHEATTDGLE